jgi:hypothetical protein
MHACLRSAPPGRRGGVRAQHRVVLVWREGQRRSARRVIDHLRSQRLRERREVWKEAAEFHSQVDPVAVEPGHILAQAEQCQQRAVACASQPGTGQLRLRARDEDAPTRLASEPSRTDSGMVGLVHPVVQQQHDENTGCGDPASPSTAPGQSGHSPVAPAVPHTTSGLRASPSVRRLISSIGRRGLVPRFDYTCVCSFTRNPGFPENRRLCNQYTRSAHQSRIGAAGGELHTETMKRP